MMVSLGQGDLHLTRDGVSYTLSNNKGNSAAFLIGTAEQLTTAYAHLAGVPNLDDLISINTRIPADERPIQQAAALILSANQNIPFRSLGKNYQIKFDETERAKFDEIIKKLPKAGLAYVMKAIHDKKIRLIRDKTLYTLTSNDGDVATFLLGTVDQLNEFESKQQQEAEKIVKQFYDAIKNTFTFETKIIEGEEEIDVSLKFALDTDEGNRLIQSEYSKIIDVLIKLHDYKFYGMTEAVHDQLIKLFKDHPLWNNVEKYLRRDDFINYIVTHIEGKEGLLYFHSNDPLSELRAEDLRIQIDLIFNAANRGIFGEALNDYSNQLLKLIIDNSDKISPELRARVLSYIEYPRPELYKIPDALIGYALKNPGQNIEVLKRFISGSDHDKSKLKKEYMEQESMDIKLASAIITQAINDGELDIVYSYITRKDVSPSIISIIIDKAEHFERKKQVDDFFYFEYDDGKPLEYPEILRKNSLNRYVLDAVLDSMKRILSKEKRMEIYVSYLRKNNDIDQGTLEAIIEDVKTFDESNRSGFYSDYINYTKNEEHIEFGSRLS